MRAIAIAALALVFVAPAWADKPADQDKLCKKEPRICAPPTFGSTPVRSASKEEVLQAAQEPGALTEGNVADVAQMEVEDTEGGGGGEAELAVCWFQSLWVEWGVWPYQNRVTDDSYWCGRWTWGPLSYRSTHIRLGASLCNPGGAYVQRIGGGIPNWWVALRVSASFSCGLPYIGGYNIDHWYEDVHHTGGDAYIYANSN